MDGDTLTFGLLTFGIVVGTAVLIYGVEYDVMAIIGAGSAIMVGVILLMAWAVANLDEPTHAETGH